jgi:23S rRNA (cytidine1920-2'-O)/16S rRNA (cytidine1409-2'-O)-methyltransferase
VRDEYAHQIAIDRVKNCLAELGAHSIEVIDSPITGMEGNREFLLHACLDPSRKASPEC